MKLSENKSNMNKNTIEKIKHDGAVRALKDRIDGLTYGLNNNWQHIKENGVYVNLGVAISRANKTIRDMEITFHALQEMEPENK